MAETAVRKLSMEFDDAPKNTPLDARVQARVEKAGLHMTAVLQNAISEAAALSDFMKMKGELSDQKRLLKSQVAREKFLSYLSQGDSLKLDVLSQQASGRFTCRKSAFVWLYDIVCRAPLRSWPPPTARPSK
jgi:hypothetical protein